MVSLVHEQMDTVLSATTGSRRLEAMTRKLKPAGGLVHVGGYSMPFMDERQGKFPQHSKDHETG